MQSDILHQRLEQMRAQLLVRVQETGNLRDDLVVEMSQRLDLLIVLAQKMKRDKSMNEAKMIRTIA